MVSGPLRAGGFDDCVRCLGHLSVKFFCVVLFLLFLKYTRACIIVCAALAMSPYCFFVLLCALAYVCASFSLFLFWKWLCQCLKNTCAQYYYVRVLAISANARFCMSYRYICVKYCYFNVVEYWFVFLSLIGLFFCCCFVRIQLL